MMWTIFMGKGSGGFGSVIQEYVGKWLKKQNISFLPNPDTKTGPISILNLCATNRFFTRNRLLYQKRIPLKTKSLKKWQTAWFI